MGHLLQVGAHHLLSRPIICPTERQWFPANYFDTDTNDEYWISGVKAKGSNIHPAQASVNVHVDEDAIEAFRALRSD
jgi:hypothetical protein